MFLQKCQNNLIVSSVRSTEDGAGDLNCTMLLVLLIQNQEISTDAVKTKNACRNSTAIEKHYFVKRSWSSINLHLFKKQLETGLSIKVQAFLIHIEDLIPRISQLEEVVLILNYHGTNGVVGQGSSILNFTNIVDVASKVHGLKLLHFGICHRVDPSE